MITFIDRDGIYQGYDLSLIETLVTVVENPVIASGKAGSYQDTIDSVLKRYTKANVQGMKRTSPP